MAAVLTLDDALAQLSDLVDTESEPAISGDQLRRILQKTMHASVHAVSTAYRVGDRVVAAGTSYNGRYYRCVEGGETGTSAPLWAAQKRAYMGQTYRDGTVTWEDDGAAFDDLYDLQGAAYEAWMWKAQKTAQDIAIADRDLKADLTKRHQQYLTMAAVYTPMWVE